MVDFARSRETATFQSLAHEIGGHKIAPVMVEKMLKDDAEKEGCLDYFLRSSLLRQLHQHVPNGVHKHGDWKLIRALSSWVGMVGTTRDLERLSSRVADLLQHDANLPDDWLPLSHSDAKLCHFFSTARKR